MRFAWRFRIYYTDGEMDGSLKERYADYITAWRRRENAERQKTQERTLQAKAIAAHCAELLAETYGVRRVWLFGSLLSPESARVDADIDLAVEGLAPARYFAALASLYRHLPPGMELDLVAMETAQPALRQHILEKGLLIHANQ